MKDRINMYFATLLITIVGAGAASLIVHVAYANFDTLSGSEAQYAQLQKSILNSYPKTPRGS
jgi:hypothetical protein